MLSTSNRELDHAWAVAGGACAYLGVEVKNGYSGVTSSQISAQLDLSDRPAPSALPGLLTNPGGGLCRVSVPSVHDRLQENKDDSNRARDGARDRDRERDRDRDRDGDVNRDREDIDKMRKRDRIPGKAFENSNPKRIRLSAASDVQPGNVELQPYPGNKSPEHPPRASSSAQSTATSCKENQIGSGDSLAGALLSHSFLFVYSEDFFQILYILLIKSHRRKNVLYGG
jgi:hypothetical protein